MHTLNLVLSFITILLIVLIIKFNDQYVIQKTTRILYKTLKLSFLVTLISYIISWFLLGPNLSIVAMSLGGIILIWLLREDQINGTTQRIFSDEHHRRPALSNRTMVGVMLILAVSIWAGAISAKYLS